MSVNIKYAGLVPSLEVTTSSAWVHVPQTDPARIGKFGPDVPGIIDLTPGDQLPQRLALLSLLRDAWINKRDVELILNLAVAQDQSGQPLPIDENYPYVFGLHTCYWICERVTVRSDK